MGESARMGLRAALAAALAVVLTRVFALPRSYWAILVAVVIVGQTWGDSVRLAVHRFGMTALGCFAGALIHVAVADHPDVELVFLFVGVFFAAYFRLAAGAGSYPWMVFSVSIYVVFLFATLDRSNLRGILVVRLQDTAAGCVAALSAASLVPPSGAGKQLDDELCDLWNACRSLIEAEATPSVDATWALLRRADALRSRLVASGYESVFSGARRRAAALVRETEGLCHAVLSLAQSLGAVRYRALPPAIDAEIRAVRAHVIEDLASLATASRAAFPVRRPAPRGVAWIEDGCLGHDDFVLVGAVIVHAEDVCLHVAELRRILLRP
ncbi:putative integral membrane protein [Minicystis rosea]|nr:putative integral membrane protein [Minicystis rosea]